MGELKKIKYSKLKNNQLRILTSPLNGYRSIKNQFNQDDPYQMSLAIGMTIACEISGIKDYEPVMIGRSFHIMIHEHEFEKLERSPIYKVANQNDGQVWIDYLNDKENIKIACDVIEKIYNLYNHPNVISPNSFVPKGLQNDLVDKYYSLN